MSSYPLGEELAVVQKRRASMTLQDQVAQLFEEARDDVYRYLLSLGLYPPQAQEAAQEVFLRLYTTLKKGEDRASYPHRRRHIPGPCKLADDLMWRGGEEIGGRGDPAFQHVY